MIPYAIEIGDIQPRHLEVYRRVVNLINTFPDGLSCHDVCERLVQDESLKSQFFHKRGYFGLPPAPHSWIVFRSTPSIVLDPYPWAHGSGPTLLSIDGYLNPQSGLYHDTMDSFYLLVGKWKNNDG